MEKQLTQNTFITQLSDIVRNQHLSVIDGIIYWCETNKCEIEDVVSLIKGNKQLLSKIKEEGHSLSLLKKETIDNQDSIF